MVLGSPQAETGISALDGQAARVEAFKDKVFDPWLEAAARPGGHGTLIHVEGVQSSDFASLLANLDLAVGDHDVEEMAEAGFVRDRKTNTPKGDDKIELVTYLKFHTAPANVLIKEVLLESGFNPAQVGEIKYVLDFQQQSR